MQRVRRIGYYRSKQEGSHISCVHESGHRIIIPNKKAIRVGTLQDIIKRIATRLRIGEDEVLDMLDL